MIKIAIIPARGGSKRIPQKNIRLFHERPMIAWSIEAALQSRIFDHVLVSTDDLEIAEIARKHGAEVPFMRPKNLADDHTPTVPVIAHAVDWACKHIGDVEAVCCIYATAPFIEPSDLLTTYELLHSSQASYCFPATTFPFPIQRAIRLDTRSRVTMFDPQHAQTRSQDLEEAYHDAGQFYWGWARSWLQGLPIIGPDAVASLIPRHRVQDIDTLEDWTRAELLFRVLCSSAD